MKLFQLKNLIVIAYKALSQVIHTFSFVCLFGLFFFRCLFVFTFVWILFPFAKFCLELDFILPIQAVSNDEEARIIGQMELQQLTRNLQV